MKVYNKLIRDKIPEIIEASGKTCEITVLGNEEYRQELNKKLQEELQEYYESETTEELADLLELIYAIAEHKGITAKELEGVMLAKREERGGFQNRLFLHSVS